jgi:membrane protein required for colicin V production
MVAYVAIFIVTLLLMGLLTQLITGCIKAAKLGTFDRALGAGFGFARGVVIVLIATLLAGLTGLPREPAWRNSWCGARLALLASRAKPWLPSALAKHIRYD